MTSKLKSYTTIQGFLYYCTCVYHEAGMRHFILSQSSPIGLSLPRLDNWSLDNLKYSMRLNVLLSTYKNMEKSGKIIT